MSRVHDLRCVQPFFEDVADGRKAFEVRRDDRDFMVGDQLRLREFDATDGYSGAEVWRVITYFLEGGQFGIEPGWCVLGMSELEAVR